MDPQSEALRFRLRMTRGVSFPHPFRHSRESGNPDPTGSPIRSALLSVEDDKGCVIPASPPSFPRKRESSPNGSRIKCGMTKRNVDPQSEALRFRLRMTRGSQAGDDKGCVIPAQAGIQSGLDLQSEALRFRLGMTRGVSFP